MPLFPFGTIGFGALALEVSAQNVSGFGSDFRTCGTVTASGPNVQVTGGSESYTYQWTQVGNPAQRGPYAIFSATQKNPYWRQSVCEADSPKAESWGVTVTDTVTGQQAFTSISVLLSWTDIH